MKKLLVKHKQFWTERHLILQVFVGLFLLFLSLVATYYANYYTLTHASNSVTDILIDNLPVINVSFVFNEGAFIFLGFIGLILIREPKRIPFVLKAIAFFMLIRSVFMTLTHIAPPIGMIPADTSDIIYRLSSGNDLFFSAHTGMPFLLAIIFWNHKYLKYIFLACSIIGGISVILGHLHYSIDVLSAFFITFGIFHISKWMFGEDYKLLVLADKDKQFKHFVSHTASIK